MNIARTAVGLVAAAGIAGPALAQDSISTNPDGGNGLPGDAPSAFAAGDQVDRYAIDLVPFNTSWGTEFGLGVLHKSPNVDGDGGFFGSLISAQAISPGITTAVLDGVEFQEWSEPGFGVSENNFEPTSSVLLDGEFLQQATAFDAFSGTSSTLNTTLINIDPSDSSRLFVTRVLAANGESAMGVKNAEFGLGSIDASGNVYFRADDFDANGPDPIAPDRFGRVRTADRTAGQFNSVTGPTVTGQEATDDIRGGSSFLTPNNIPADIFGGSGSILANSFSAPLITEFNLSGQSIPSNGTRGAWSTSINPFDGFSEPGALTASILDQDSEGITRAIRVVAVDAAGAFTGSNSFFNPSNSVTDNSNGFALNTGDAASVHHVSQTRFQGSSQADAQVTPAGDLIATATLAVNQSSRFDQDPDNFIVAFRETPDGTVEETLVAYVTFTDNKEILDGPGGNAIGTLLPIDLAFTGSLGPSMSAPAIDSAGNIWFACPFQLDGEEFADVGLFRAVYNRDDFSYELELVVRTGFDSGTTLTGLNSQTPFQLTFGPPFADNNSVSSGTFWSSNVSNDAALGQNAGDFEPADPNTLGGAVLSVELSYDVNGDGIFDDPTSPAGDASSPDEAYTAIVYIGALTSVEEDCPFEFDGQPGLNDGDLNAYIDAFRNNPSNPRLEFNGEPGLTLGDLSAFIAAFQDGQQNGFPPECE